MSSFLDRVRAQMSGSIERPVITAREEKARHSIVTNRWDERVWTVARPTEPIDRLVTDLALGDEHKGGERGPFDPAPELVRDLWMGLYKAAPELIDKARVDRSVYAARRVLEEMLQADSFQELQALTAGDPVLSTIAAQGMHEQLVELVTRIPPPPPPPAPGGQGPDPDGQGDGDDREQDADGDDGDGNRQWQADYDAALDDAGLDRAMARAVEAARKEAEETTDARRGIGIEDGEWQAMNPQERMAVAERLRTPNMRRLADLVGRMKRFALGTRATRIVNVPHEAFDVEQGRDLRHLLAGEYALLGTPETSYEFYRRYADGELLQFKMRGRELAGLGPIVCCIDKSGSMQGEPIMWAMAVAEALRRFAADDGRDYRALMFGSNRDRHTFDFPQGKADFDKVMAFLGCQANGGTDFDGVLDDALKTARTAFDADAKGKADIVFITDGMALLTEEWIEEFNKERDRIGVRVFSVYISGAPDSYSSPVALLRRVSDAVITVKDLDPASAKDVFASV